MPIDDLLSKPSLADPESVFSEAGSYDFSRSALAVSWLRVSGEGGSLSRESVSISALGVDEKAQSNITALPNQTPDAFPKWNVHSHKQAQVDQTDKLLKHGQQLPQQGHSSNGHCKSPFPETQTTDESSRHSDNFIHDLSRSVAGSPKYYTHKDISGRVRVDSAALQIHRDSVTQQSVPFLNSTRCSFSHEVGHIVHGTKVPRTSLPTTEEQGDGSCMLSSVPNNEMRASGQKELSLQVLTEQRKKSCSEKTVISNCEKTNDSNKLVSDKTADQHICHHGGTHTESESASHKDSSSGNTSRSKVRSDISPGSLTRHFEESHHGPVPMRRCFSCVHGDGVCDKQLSRTGRKTFSLNLQIDIHFENGIDNLSTFVCSPRINYSHCDATASDNCSTCVAADNCSTCVASDNCNTCVASNNCSPCVVSDNCNTNVVSDMYEKYATNSDMIKQLTPSSMTTTNQVSFRDDTTAKEMLLQKSFELKSQNANSRPFVTVHQRRSEPVISVKSDLKDCNVRQFSRLSESGPSNRTASRVTNSQLVPGQGQRPSTALGHRSDLYEFGSRHRDHLSGSARAQTLHWKNANVPGAQTSPELGPDTGCLNSPIDKTDTKLGKSFTITSHQLPIKEPEKTSLTPGRVNVGDCSAIITDNNESGMDRSDIRLSLTNTNLKAEPGQHEPQHLSLANTNLKAEKRLDIIGEKERCRYEGRQPTGNSSSNNIQYEHKEAAQAANTNTLNNRVGYQLKADSTNNPTTAGGSDHGAASAVRGSTHGTTKRCVVEHDVAYCPYVTSAVRPDVTPAARSDVTQATRIEITSATRSDITPAVHPDVTSATRPGVTPAVHPEVTSATRPGVTPATRHGVTPAVRPDFTPATRPDVTPGVHPAVAPANRSDVTPAVRPDITPGANSNVTPVVCPDITPAANSNVTPVVCPDITPGANSNVTPVVCPDITSAANSNVTPVVCPDITSAANSNVTPVVCPDITPGANSNVTPVVCPDVSQKSAEASSGLLHTHADTEDAGPVVVDVKEAGPAARSSGDGKNSSLHDCNRRAQTVKKIYGWGTAKAADDRFTRASSLKVHTSDKSVEEMSPTQENNQQRRQAVLFMKDDLTKWQASFERENLSRPDIKDTQKTQEVNSRNQLSLTRVKKADSQEYKNTNIQKKTSDITQVKQFSKGLSQEIMFSSKVKQDMPDFDELNALKDTEQTIGVMKDKGESQDNIWPTNSEERMTLSGQHLDRYPSDLSYQGKESKAEIELREISDDSDYDNPWDDLDDAVKRASIRYNRRPSRIAAGDDKTLLLKSAEDLGRLLEEADKKRQLRQARNSYQITSPECGTESMTIPFTRYSPHRHTVKGIVSQPHLNTSHSSEDILKAHNPKYPKLSLLRQVDVPADPSGKPIDARRPMSLSSKVKAKVLSPETKKRKT